MTSEATKGLGGRVPPPWEGEGWVRGEARRGALRLFPNYDPEDFLAPGARPFLLARLLEDGDGADLHELFRAISEPAAAAWFAAHGGRQLSARSRAFWRLVLGTEPGPAAPAASALWPL